MKTTRFCYVFTGFVQFVESVAVAEILAVEGSILTYFRKRAPNDNTASGIAPELMDNYIKSCGLWGAYFIVVWSVSLWRDPDDVSHCRILSPDKTEWRLISATLCGWRRCFVADQLWLMTRIREEEEDCGLCAKQRYPSYGRGNGVRCVIEVLEGE